MNIRNIKFVLPLIILVTALTGCQVPEVGDFSDIFSPGVSLRDLDGIKLDSQEDRPTWDYPDIQLGDGRIQRIMWMSSGESAPMSKIIVNVPQIVDKRVTATVVDNFPTQNRIDESGNFKSIKPAKMEALSLVGRLEDVDTVTDVVIGVQTSVAQIEVSVRIVEVLETDITSFGLDTGFNSVESDPSQPTRTFFNSASTTLGLPELPGRGGGFNPSSLLVPLLLDFGTISNGVQIDFLIRALKQFARTDLLSAPHLRVLDGYTAQITATEEIPFLTPNFNAVGISSVTTQFKSVGIKLFIQPKVIGRELVRINLTTAVEAVTGESTFESNGASITNPIITSRKASTFMDVYNGDTAIIGGLLRRSTFKNQKKVPVLGEVPILSSFFSSESEETSQSNLIFFITPKVIDPSLERRRIITPVPMAPDDEDK
ncbi:MAG: type II secretory pathway component GspD/PulD (secretin) [Planctomycetota bacterium]